MIPSQEQLERTRRYYLRFKRLNDGIEHFETSETHLDDIYAFFQNCYHIKDWLKNDSAYTSHSNQEIEDYVTNTIALSICADICNGSKHLQLQKPPRSGAVPELGKKTITAAFAETLSGEEFPTPIKMNVEVKHAGNKLDAFQLATDALHSWESFII